MRRIIFQKLLFALLAFLFCSALPVFADEDALETLRFTDIPEETLVSTSSGFNEDERVTASSNTPHPASSANRIA